MLSLGQFSTVANASTEAYDLMSLNWRVAIADDNFNYIVSTDGENQGGVKVRPLNFLLQTNFLTNGYFYPQYLMFEYTSHEEKFNVATSQIIVNKGDGFSVALDNYRDVIAFYDVNNTFVNEWYRIKFEPVVTVQIFDIAGNYITVQPTNVKTDVKNSRLSFSLDVESVPFDVYRFRVICYEATNPYNINSGWEENYSTWNRVFMFDQYASHSVKNIPEEKGLLKSIISWLKEIKDKIVSVADSISQLPEKLWNKISEGLKGLFVPKEDYITGYSSKWDELLSLRFGAIYEVGSFLTNIGSEMVNVMKSGDKIETLTFPVAKIPVGSGEFFEFGGWEVNLKVDKLDSLYKAIHLLSGGGMTFLFLSGLRKRYDEVMGG